MTKFLVLYNSNASATELMASATPEQMQESMAEWIVWHDEANKTAKVDWGLPLQARTNITPTGSDVSHNAASGYSIIEADSVEVVNGLLAGHPHLKREGASIDVLEMIAMPGV